MININNNSIVALTLFLLCFISFNHTVNAQKAYTQPNSVTNNNNEAEKIILKNAKTISKTPLNNLCNDAIFLNCNMEIEATNINASFDGSNVFTACGIPRNTVWFIFEANANNTIIHINEATPGVDLIASILNGSCGRPFDIVYCQSFFESTELNFATTPGETYFLQIGGNRSNDSSDFKITVQEGLGNCDEVCRPDFTVTSYCTSELDDFFYVDIEVFNLGRSSGFMVNGGAYPNITEPGKANIGPFYASRDTLTLVSLDDSGCFVKSRVSKFCGCTYFNDVKQPYGTVTILERDSALLRVLYPNEANLPSLHPFDCNVQWVTDLSDPSNSIVGTGDYIYVSPPPGGITNYYALINCTNSLSCEVMYSVQAEPVELCEEEFVGYYPYFPGCTSNVGVALYDRHTLIDDAPTLNTETMEYVFVNGPYPCGSEVKFSIEDCDLDFSNSLNCDDLIATASSGTVLTWGDNYNFYYYNYSWQAELNIELEDTQNCQFLYWITDLSNPTESVVSTEEHAVIDIYGGAFITYYGIVLCDNENICMEELTIITPIFDLPPPPPPPPDYIDEEEPGNPDPGEEPGSIDPCADSAAGNISSIDKYVCFGDTPDVTLIDTEIPTDFSIYYAYHNSTDLSESSVIYALSFDDLVTPENVLPCATQIYLTAFIAPTVSNISEINLSNSCSISNTIEITYLCPVQIQVQEICNRNGTYNLVVTVTGGLPQVLPNVPYSIYGTVYKGSSLHGQTFTITNLPDGSSYQIEAVDSEMCHNWVTGSVQCDKLPVELLTFKGEAHAEGNLLKWSTATEIDNDYFTIESSINGIDFNKIGNVKGAGSSSATQNYQWLDRQAGNGLTHYRLSQTDFDGLTTIEATTEINRGEASGITLIQTYPVPFLDELNLQLYNTTENEVEITLTDIMGREMISKQFILQQGYNEIALSAASLPKGLYMIAIKGKYEVSYQKVIKD